MATVRGDSSEGAGRVSEGRQGEPPEEGGEVSHVRYPDSSLHLSAGRPRMASLSPDLPE